MNYDAIIVGGSFAGLSAAMQLGRARRNVLVIDAGKPRNRSAAAAHGFFAQDGVPPLELLQTARAKVLNYPNVRLYQGEAGRAERREDGSFSVALRDGERFTAAGLILASGIVDELPSIPGMQERWGSTVLHCPYCHGYEVRDRALGVLYAMPMSAHTAALIADWGPVTFFTQGNAVPAEARTLLEQRGVRVEPTPVVALLGAAPALSGVRLADGRVLPLDALFTATRTRMASELAAQLGCAFDEGPFGPILRVDGAKLTSVPGVFAAGDSTRAAHNATFASADGVMAGVSLHQMLVFGAPLHK